MEENQDKMENEDKKTEDTATTPVAPTVDPFEKLAGEIKSLTDAVKASQAKAHSNGEVRSDDKEKIAKMEAEVAALTDILQKSEKGARKAEFEADEDRNGAILNTASLKSILNVKATRDSMYEEVQLANDEAYIGMVALGINTPWQSRTLKNYIANKYPNAYKAMDNSSTGYGPEWIPTGFSRNMIQQVMLDLRVAALHPRFNMPTNPFTFPVEGSDISAYVVAQATGDNDSVNTSAFVPAASPGTGNLTFTAKKVGVRSVLSTEITEDSIVAVVPYVREKIARSLAQAQENTVINGDVRLSSNIDGVTVGTVQTTAYNGYRRAAQLAATTVDLATFDLTNLRKLRKAMGKYGVDTNQLVYVTGVSGYHKLLGLTEVLTVDKFGARATILNGQIGSLDGIPIVISAYVADTYDAAGLNMGTSSKTELLLIRKDCFSFGDWRDIQLKNREVIETDQLVLVALQRLDYKALYTPSATNTIAAAGVGITP